MKKISLKKVKLEELEVFQNAIHIYSSSMKDVVGKQQNLLQLNTVLELCILKRLFHKFRDRLEGPSFLFTITLLPSEAVILLYACQYFQKVSEDNSYSESVAEKYKCQLDQQVKSVVIYNP